MQYQGPKSHPKARIRHLRLPRSRKRLLKCFWDSASQTDLCMEVFLLLNKEGEWLRFMPLTQKSVTPVYWDFGDPYP